MFKKCFLCKRGLKRLYLRDGKKYYCTSCTNVLYRFGFFVSDIISNIKADKRIKERSENTK